MVYDSTRSNLARVFRMSDCRNSFHVDCLVCTTHVQSGVALNTHDMFLAEVATSETQAVEVSLQLEYNLVPVCQPTGPRSGHLI